MKNFIKNLESELNNVINNYDYYDTSAATKSMIELEKRQIGRLIKFALTIEKVSTKTKTTPAPTLKQAFEAGCEVFYDDNDGRRNMPQSLVDERYKSFINNFNK